MIMRIFPKTRKKGDVLREEMLEGSIVIMILRLSYPIFIAVSFHTIFNLVDTYYVSRLGSEALAAMGLTFPFFMLTVALTQGVGIGISSLVARSVGANDEKKLSQVAMNSLFLAIFLGLFFSILGLFFYPLLLAYMGARGDIGNMASSYLRIMFLFLPFKFILLTFEGLFRGEGKTRLSMGVMLVATICNIILDPLFIFGLGPFPAMGITGASLATALSWMVGILLGKVFFTSHSSLPIVFKGFQIVKDIYVKIIQVGLPASLSTGIMSISMIFLNRFAYEFSPAVVAAYAIGFRVESLTILPGLAIASATITMVGQNYGASHYLRAKEAHQAASLVVVLIMGTISLFIFLFPRFLAAFFIVNGEEGEKVLTYSMNYLRIVTFSYSFCGLGFVSNASFLGTGLGLPSLFNAILRFFFLTLPITYLLAIHLHFGPSGIWFGISLANIAFGLISYFWFQRYSSQLSP